MRQLQIYAVFKLPPTKNVYMFFIIYVQASSQVMNKREQIVYYTITGLVTSLVEAKIFPAL